MKNFNFEMNPNKFILHPNVWKQVFCAFDCKNQQE